ncbi:MAG: sigma-54-dependent Fis family transcriptional regulator [Phycisphaeraceae bacterium]|nr:sigma-54-dependent Fis family transcriptional regulator [Phycisphaeraceae bacterium]
MPTASKHEKLAAQVLIVEDEAEHAEVMAEALKKFGHVCTIVGGVAAALDEFRHGQFDVIITDLRMPSSAGVGGTAADGGDAGLRVLQAARELQPQAETIMVTAHGDVPTARAAFKFGAYDFIEKPLDLEVFRNLVNRAAETVLLRHEAMGGGEGAGLNELVQHDGFEGIIAGSEPMRRILQTVRAVAPSNIPVLITGESGTGKELIAQAIHRNSQRAKARFVPFNCAGQSESLLEDALFGHVRGAFTGAEKDREGVFEYAGGAGAGHGGGPGTLFLDEIGDMPLTMQAKLLRVLESGEVVRLGSNEARKVDVRFVSATNKDLVQASKEGKFREDLYFRIKGAHIHLPPLRERREDIPRIARHAIARFAAQMTPAAPKGKSQPAPMIPDITDAAMMRLTAYSWPGNVRQLLNVIQNMVVMAMGEAAAGVGGGAGDGAVRIDTRHIPDEVSSPDAPEDEGGTVAAADGSIGAGGAGAGLGGGAGAGIASLAGTSLEQLEKRAIRETLRLTAGNREKAAQLLGIGERTLYRKLKEYGLR